MDPRYRGRRSSEIIQSKDVLYQVVDEAGTWRRSGPSMVQYDVPREGCLL